VALLANPAAQQAQLLQGRDIYVTRCAKCHSVEPVINYSREKWVHEIIPDMAEETNLTTSETEAVKAYVLAVLANPPVAVR
jgi:mono/diheme cytochrome c family protein